MLLAETTKNLVGRTELARVLNLPAGVSKPFRVNEVNFSRRLQNRGFSKSPERL